MNDELTAVDIKKMEQEVEYRRLQLRPQLLEDVKTAREFGDLSENFDVFPVDDVNICWGI